MRNVHLLLSSELPLKYLPLPTTHDTPSLQFQLIYVGRYGILPTQMLKVSPCQPVFWLEPTGSGQQIVSLMGDKCLQLGTAFAHKGWLLLSCQLQAEEVM